MLVNNNNNNDNISARKSTCFAGSVGRYNIPGSDENQRIKKWRSKYILFVILPLRCLLQYYIHRIEEATKDAYTLAGDLYFVYRYIDINNY